MFNFDKPLIIISGPSGVGKFAVIHGITARDHRFQKMITCTTRRPTSQKITGEDYHFFTLKKFKRYIAERKFIEWTITHGNYYGTPKSELNKISKAKKYPIIEVDVKGGLKIKKKIKNVILIFIKPASFNELVERIESRGRELNPAAIQTRLERARSELKLAKYYDFRIINRQNQLDRTVNRALNIIKLTFTQK